MAIHTNEQEMRNSNGGGDSSSIFIYGKLIDNIYNQSVRDKFNTKTQGIPCTATTCMVKFIKHYLLKLPSIFKNTFHLNALK
jgi:hypothetical protein